MVVPATAVGYEEIQRPPFFAAQLCNDFTPDDSITWTQRRKEGSRSMRLVERASSGWCRWWAPRKEVAHLFRPAAPFGTASCLVGLFQRDQRCSARLHPTNSSANNAGR